MATGTRNLMQAEAAERSRLLSVASYDIRLELSDDLQEPTFRSHTEVAFACSELGASIGCRGAG